MNDLGKKKVDEDWKRQVAQEKAKAEKKEEPKPGDPTGPTPFMEFINALASEVMIYLGAVAHPQTGEAVFAPEQAKQTIDILHLLEQKTKGNLTPDEEKLLTNMVHELRLAYVESTRAAQAPQTA